MDIICLFRGLSLFTELNIVDACKLTTRDCNYESGSIEENNIDLMSPHYNGKLSRFCMYRIIIVEGTFMYV